MLPQAFVARQGVLSLYLQSNERKVDFLNKENNKLILRYLNEGKTTIREIAKITDASTATIMKVKKVAIETKQLKVA